MVRIPRSLGSSTMMIMLVFSLFCLTSQRVAADVASPGPVRVKLSYYSLELQHEANLFDSLTVFQANRIRDIAEELLERTLSIMDFGPYAEYQTAHLSGVDEIERVDNTTTILVLRGGLVVFKRHSAVPPTEEELEAILAETMKGLGDELQLNGYDTVTDVVYNLEDPFPTPAPSPPPSGDGVVSGLTKDELRDVRKRDRAPRMPILLGCLVGFALATILVAGFALRRRRRQRRYEEWKEDSCKELKVKELSSFDDEPVIPQSQEMTDKQSEVGSAEDDRMSNGSGSESVGSSRLGRMLTSLGRLSSIREESDEDGTTKDISEEEEMLSFASTTGGIRTVEPSIIPLDQVESFEHARNASQRNRIQKDMLATSGTAAGGASNSWASYITMLMGGSAAGASGNRNQALEPTDSSAAALAKSDENSNSFYGFAPWFTGNNNPDPKGKSFSGSDDDSSGQYGDLRPDDAWNFNDNDRDSNDSDDNRAGVEHFSLAPRSSERIKRKRHNRRRQNRPFIYDAALETAEI